jgi:hypothetical protein
MDLWASLEGLAPEGEYSPVFTWDDSILTDTDTMFARDTQLLRDKVMSRVEFRMKHFGEDEETAKKAIEEIDKDVPEDLFTQMEKSLGEKDEQKALGKPAKSA